MSFARIETFKERISKFRRTETCHRNQRCNFFSKSNIHDTCRQYPFIESFENNIHWKFHFSFSQRKNNASLHAFLPNQKLTWKKQKHRSRYTSTLRGVSTSRYTSTFRVLPPFFSLLPSTSQTIKHFLLWTLKGSILSQGIRN